MIQSFIESMVVHCIILSPIYFIGRFFVMYDKEKCLIREGCMYIFFLYCVCIFSQTIVPHFAIINGELDFYFTRAYVSNNFTPFETILLYTEQLSGPLAKIAFYNLAGNIVLFIPFGILLPFLWRPLRSFWRICIIALFIPLFIEGTQYFIGRSVDIDDVILNTCAIIFGYFVFAILERVMKMMNN